MLPCVAGAALGRLTVDLLSSEAVREVGALLGVDLGGRPLAAWGLRAAAAET